MIFFRFPAQIRQGGDMLLFSFRKAALYAFFGGLLFPVAAAAVEVIPLSEPVDPQPAADLINTSPTAENFPFHNRLTAGPKQPSWNFTGLVGTASWNKYGLRPSAFTGNRTSDPASYPVLQTTISPQRSSARRPRARAAAPRTAAPKATAAPVKAAPAPKIAIVSVPVPTPAPKPATPEVYSAPATPVAPPAPASADAVPTPAPNPAPAIKAE